MHLQIGCFESYFCEENKLLNPLKDKEGSSFDCAKSIFKNVLKNNEVLGLNFSSVRKERTIYHQTKLLIWRVTFLHSPIAPKSCIKPEATSSLNYSGCKMSMNEWLTSPFLSLWDKIFLRSRLCECKKLETQISTQ